MDAQFRESFVKDLRAIRDKSLLRRVQQVIEMIEQARDLGEVANLVRLKGESQYYRVRVGDYRLGLSVDGKMVTFVRFLHRREIYRYFP